MTTSSFRSVPDMFLKRVEETPDSLAFQFPKGSDWGTWTWQETLERVRAVACGLRALGLESEDRCAILSNTRIEWVQADLGILCAAGATTTVYPSNTPDECAFILSDSGARIVFAEDDEQVDKLVGERENIPDVIKVINFDGEGGHDGWVITFDELQKLGNDHHKENPELFEEVAGSVELEHLATLIYTSGTTGKPKGVELLHDCWVFEAESINELKILSPDDHQYLWLPLSHSLGKVLQVMQLLLGFPTTVDGRIPKIVENLAVVKPTFMGAPPRIFEKVYNKVITGAQSGGAVKYGIFKWALGVGKEASAVIQQGGQPSGMLALKYKLATKLVFSKLQALFGGRVRFFISGAAPLSREIAEFFHAAGVLILEGYGLTETSAASFVNRPESFKFGTVGPPLPGVEVKLEEADNEILIRGRGVMRAYRNREDATKETLTEDGWLRTGDIGELDPQGRLKITDRKKDLIKTSGGKYVAPQSLEGGLKVLCPYIGQVVVHGNNRNFCTALVTIDEESIGGWAEENGLSGSSYEELIKNEKVVAMVQEAVDELNRDLASYETIKKFAILPRDLSVEGGELTPSMKVKRRVVEDEYRDILDGFYKGTMAEQ